MSYKPLSLNPKGNYSEATSLMSPAGVNLRTAPQFLDTSQALRINNYLIEDEGKLAKRKGITKAFEVAGGYPITMFKKWTDDVFVFGYNTTVAYYTLSTDTVAFIKTDFSANDGFDGARYGEYFFICNGVDKIWRVDNTYATAAIAASPICRVLQVICPRLYAGGLSTDETAVQYSESDDGTNPPFNTWSTGTLATDGGTAYYRNAGPVRSIVPLGDNIVVFSDDGYYSFTIDTFDSAGTLSKSENISKYTEDYGGARGAITSEYGIFYANEAGLWQMTALGQQDVPFNKQEALVSVLLGNQYFSDVNFSNADITHYRDKKSILMTCAKASDTNNLVLVYNLDFKAFTTITGWNISRFLDDNGGIYGASSTETVAYGCFLGSADDGLNIGTEYYQELNLAGLEYRSMLQGLYVQGFLSPSSVIKVRFDIYDRQERLITDKLVYEWSPENNNNGYDGYNSAQYSGSAYGGDSDLAGLVEDFNGCRPFIRNFHRIRVRLTSGDKLSHQITYIKVSAKPKVPIRRRGLTQTT